MQHIFHSNLINIAQLMHKIYIGTNSHKSETELLNLESTNSLSYQHNRTSETYIITVMDCALVIQGL